MIKWKKNNNYEGTEQLKYYKIRLEDYTTIGGIMLSSKNGRCYIQRMFIDVSYQNKGLGKYVLDYIQTLHPEIEEWELDTPCDNIRTNHFYVKCGFKLTKTDKGLNYYRKLVATDKKSESEVMIMDHTNLLQNEVLNCILARRSTRNYQERQIDAAQLDTILNAAIWAPSGGNNQSWLFTAIQKKEILLEINELVKEGFQHWSPDDDYPGKLGAKAASEKPNYNFYYNAPTLILASNRPGYENAMADCALALENMFLATQSIGLGSCYINQLHWLRNDTKLREYLSQLGIPREHTLCSAAAIGYIGKESSPPPRKKDTIHIIK